MISEPQSSPSPNATLAGPATGDLGGLDAVDLRIGGRSTVATFAAAAVLIPVIAVPIWKMVTPAVIAAGTVVSLAGVITFVVLIRAGLLTQGTLWFGDFAWIALTVGLVAGSGGRSSPYFLFFPLSVLHAGAFQSQRRLTVVSLTATLAFLTPLVYDTGSTGLFVAVAIVAVPPTLVVAWGFNVALATLRRQRRELSAAALRAEQEARTDALTGLGNLRQLRSTLERETARARRRQEQFSLVLVDLDRFKAINDEGGHPAGDAALRAVAMALRSQLREEDVCCRHGGDEFAVVAVGAGAVEAGDLAVRLIASIADVNVSSKPAFGLGATAGWATFSDPASNEDDLMRTADAMLLERKYGRPR
jgi:diguanylate cyclase (GGDEF)-like protein